MSELVFWAVVLSRFVVPLFIPRFPLPAIIAALVIDAADQTIFASFGVEPPNYQGYDKALDIYYLAIAYLSTIRNWPLPTAFGVAAFLWYYRLVGVVAFEYTDARFLLLLFPNTFEYFFIAYEAIRTAWNPARLSKKQVIGMAAAIWIFIKLPQEYWIHIAQLDVTDTLDAYPILWIPLIGVPTAIVAYLYSIRSRFPRPDWSFTMAVDSTPTTVANSANPPDMALLSRPILEKTALIGLIVAIFLQLLPTGDYGLVPVLLWAAAVVAANAAISSWLGGDSYKWEATFKDFLGTSILNIGIIAVIQWFLPGDGADLTLMIFLALLLSLIVTLYDRYRNLRRVAVGTTVDGLVLS